MKTVFDRRSFVTGLTAAAAAAIAPSPIYAWQLTGRHKAKKSLLPDIPGLPAASPESVGVVADISARIGTFMQRHINAGRSSGGVTALARHGKLIHFAAHGMLDVESGTPTGLSFDRYLTERVFEPVGSTCPNSASASNTRCCT